MRMTKPILTAMVILGVIIAFLIPMAGAAMWDLKDIVTGKQMVPADNSGAPWFADNSKMYFGTDKDAYLDWVSASSHWAFVGATNFDGNMTLASGHPLTAPGGFVGPLTGTASRVAMGDFIDTNYGLSNYTTNKIRVDLASNKGLEFSSYDLAVKSGYGIATDSSGVKVNFTADKGLQIGTGSALGSIEVEAGNGIKLSSGGVAVEPTDIIDTLYGLKDNSDDIRINLTADAGLEFGTGSAIGSLQAKAGDGIDLGASGIAVDVTDLTGDGIKEVATNNLALNYTADKGLALGSGANTHSIEVKPGDGVDVDSSGVGVDVTDLMGDGIKEEATNNIALNFTADKGLTLGSGAYTHSIEVKPGYGIAVDSGGVKAVASDASLAVAAGGISFKVGALKHILKDGTAATTNVTVSGMAAGDELISAFSYTNKTAIASVADRTTDYTVGAGILVKAGGTNETGNQLDIWYIDRT